MQFHLTGLEWLIQWSFLCSLREQSTQLCGMWSGTKNLKMSYASDLKRLFSTQVESFISMWCDCKWSFGTLRYFYIIIQLIFSLKTAAWLWVSNIITSVTKKCFVSLAITGKSGQAIQNWWKIYSTHPLQCILYVCLTPMAPLCCYYFPLQLSQLIYIQQRNSSNKLLLLYRHSHNINSFFRNAAALNPFLLHIIYEPAVLQHKQQNLRANFTCVYHSLNISTSSTAAS